MYEKGIVHRDLKVDNLIIDISKDEIEKIKFLNRKLNKPSFTLSSNLNIKELKVKIIDLNVSRSRDFKNSEYSGESKKNMIMYSISGTPHFSAPELLRCMSYTEQVDIWSVGCIIYYLCLGEIPFKGNS